MKPRTPKKKSSPHFEQLVKKFRWSMAMNSLQRILNKACHQPLRDLQIHCEKSLGSSLKKHTRQLSQGTDSSFGETKIPEINKVQYTPTANQHRKFKSSDFTSQIVNRKSEFRRNLESQRPLTTELVEPILQAIEKKRPIENEKVKTENQKPTHLLMLLVFIIVLFFIGLLLI